MGLLDKLFGGGTKLEIQLDAEKIPEGGTLAGTITLSGGKKPLRLTMLKVRLCYVKVEARDDSPIPSVELVTLLDNTVAANEDLAPASLNKYEFSFKVPEGTDPEAKYQVVAVADIPGVKDPSAQAVLKIISPSDGSAGRGIFGLLRGKASEDDILGQFPGLMAGDEDDRRQALSDLECAAYDRDKNFVAIAPFLSRLIGSESSERVRAQALSTWGNVLDNRAEPQHIEALTAMVNDPSISGASRLMRELVSVAAKFAEEGALPLVQWLAQHPDPAIRSELASRLRFDADDDLAEKRPLLTALAQDGDPGVRAAAISGLSAYTDDPALMADLAQRAASDPSPDAQAACLSSITLSCHHGMADLVFATFQQHIGNPHVRVRKEIAESCHWLPTDPRLAQIVQTLLSDPSPEVRRAMAWQGVNMSEHPELTELFVRACDDPDEEVGRDALRSMANIMPMDQAVQFYRHRMAQVPTESTYKGILWGIRYQIDEHPAARQLMQELTGAPFAEVARDAREALAG